MSFIEPKSAGFVVATPHYIFDPLNAEFGFQRDVCALPHNTKCVKFWSPKEDGLAQVWRGKLWMNPPYGRVIGTWIAKAHAAALRGALVCCLLPVRSDNDWWRFVVQAEIRFVRGRVRFEDQPGAAMFPVCIAIFHPRLANAGKVSVWQPEFVGSSKKYRPKVSSVLKWCPVLEAEKT